MGMDKDSLLGSFEEMAEAAVNAEVVTPATEVATEVAPATEVPVDNLETPKTE